MNYDQTTVLAHKLETAVRRRDETTMREILERLRRESFAEAHHARLRAAAHAARQYFTQKRGS